jgi:RNA polymerase sigma factor (sigma-70 family)
MQGADGRKPSHRIRTNGKRHSMAYPTVRSNAESQFTVLMSGYRRMIRSVIARAAGRTLRGSTDDLEQQVWMAIWRRLQGDPQIDHPVSYLYTVARREVLRAVEEELARLQHTDALPPPVARPSDDPDRVLAGRETNARVQAALANLSPDRQRAVRALLNGLDVQEVQDLFGWSYQRARNLIARGRADLRKQLDEQANVRQRSCTTHCAFG